MGQNFFLDTVNQTLLFPPSLHDWLPAGRLARFLVDVVSALDLSSIYQSYEEKDGRGQAAYAPEMMIRLLLYGVCDRRVQLAQNSEAHLRGGSFPLLVWRPAPGPRHHRRVPQASSGCPFGSVHPGVAAVCGSGPGEAGPRGQRRNQNQGQCQQAQGDEL